MSTLSSFRRRLMAGAYPKEQPNYLCFTALEDGTFSFTMNAPIGISRYQYVEYSLNGDEWVRTYNEDSIAITATTPIIEAGNVVYWRGKGSQTSYGTGSNQFSRFSSTGKFNVSGCPYSLINPRGFEKMVNLNVGTCGLAMLFDSTNVVNADGLLLPATKSSNGSHIYQRMFGYCSKLVSAKFNLPINSNSCTSQMFWNCTSLVNPPIFPKLTTYVNNAHIWTFTNCTALAEAPDLLTENVGTSNFGMLFNGCRNLSYIKMLALNIPTNGFASWVSNVAANGVFVKHINAAWTTTGTNGVPNGWTVIYYDPALDKYYLDQQRSQECDDHGNPI